MTRTYYRYWGKAQPDDLGGERYHLLPFHSLDVAACGQLLLALPQFSMSRLAEELNWTKAQIERVFVFFLALHDLGKFARAFQNIVPNLSPDLVPPDNRKTYDRRHDTLGWLIWCQKLSEDFPGDLPCPDHEFWAIWIRSVVGHHGKPPEEVGGGGLIPLDYSDYFVTDDCVAAKEFVAEVGKFLLDAELPAPDRRQVAILKKHAWRLAGLAVLADWLGSNQNFFHYQSAPLPLSEYWIQTLARAQQSISAAGLQSQSVRLWTNPQQMFDYLSGPTPLQIYASSVELEEGPQLFLLEDVTGAGKTEAALILTQRLMQAGRAHGLYFALPSMATANQMYQRVGSVYRKFYEPHTEPSLILSHGARQLIDGFRNSVLNSQTDDHCYRSDELTASVQCNTWLADNRKKALLAEIGVGTLDQALLAVLPARHQSLRLLGLSGKVLLVDEVHAYDTYMMTLLKTLLDAHARQGGSAVLLSATLPINTRQELLDAYRNGLGATTETELNDNRYPLATRVGQDILSHACETRAQVKRRVSVAMLHNEADVLNLIVATAQQGNCVCWIRNTVDDARRAHGLLSDRLPSADLMLFHSRYAMADRLHIEDKVLASFGKHSTGAQRAGKVLIGTQVLEQSLDFDMDVMVSDLAPVDLLIQRAGRLQRHARTKNGDPSNTSIEQRDAPVLYLLTPELNDSPAADWYSAMFPKASYVYPDSGKLWLSTKALSESKCIVSPGEPGECGSVRQLVEAVYGTDVNQVPEQLQKATQKQLGEDLAMQSQACFNALKLDKGYCIDSSGRWYEDYAVPTRLGDETLTVYLAKWVNDRLQPLCADENYPWEQSAVRINASQIQTLAPDWEFNFDGAIQQLRARYRVLEEPAFVLPLVENDRVLVGLVQDKRGRILQAQYDRTLGFML